MRFSRLIFAMTLIAFYGCGGPQTTSLTPTPSKEVIKKTPDWFSEQVPFSVEKG